MGSGSEFSRLDAVARNANYSEGLNGIMIRHSVDIFSRWILPGSILELGPAEGLSTSELAERFEDVEVVDGSAEFIDQIRTQLPNVKAHCSLFEDFVPTRRFQNIVMGHVLEHVEDPVQIVKLATSWLLPGGRIIAATPNSNSLHRQLGVLAGQLETEKTLNSADLSIGHRRVLDLAELRWTMNQAELKLLHSGGYFMKSLSNSQLLKLADSNTLVAMMQLGERYPDIAADIYVVAEKTC
jgi:2-polyprenyl-3-methyl-5-hydroxy-6-metoxy-1,4-benzoquinol methylase